MMVCSLLLVGGCTRCTPRHCAYRPVCADRPRQGSCHVVLLLVVASPCGAGLPLVRYGAGVAAVRANKPLLAELYVSALIIVAAGVWLTCV